MNDREQEWHDALLDAGHPDPECPDEPDVFSELERARTQLDIANSMLARAQCGAPKRPRKAASDQIQLDYDIGQHLQRHGWHWDAIHRIWRRPDASTAKWVESRGRAP